MLLQHVAHDEAVQRHPSGDELAYGRVSALKSQVAGVETSRLNRHIRLGHEVLVTCEHLQRCRLSGLIAVEGEDHLAMEGVMIAHQSTQQSCMIITEGGTA